MSEQCCSLKYKSHEPAINKTRANSNHVAPATPSSVERVLRLLHCSAMKQVDVSLRASTMAPILELPSTIPELPTTVKGVVSPEIPPTVERVAGDEQHGVAPAPSTPPSLDDNNDPFIVAQHTGCVYLWATRRRNS